MSSGAQAQINLRGPQDGYLLATDESTFWRTSYTRHTNAAVAELQVNFNMSPSYGSSKIVAQLPRNGDLISQIYLHSKVGAIQYGAVPFSLAPNNFATYVDALPHALIDQIVCKIGQSEFDTQTGYYMEALEALSAPAHKLMGEQNFRYTTKEGRAIQSTFDQELWTPLKFWFCRFYEQALPYVALYWHDVTFELTTRALSSLVQYSGACNASNTTVPAAPTALNLLVNYVYLDVPERTAFMDGEHEYVFDQVQFLGPAAVSTTSGSQQHNIRFNHPVQELIWFCQQSSNLAANDHFNWDGPAETGSVVGVTRASDPFVSARLTINNIERVVDLPANYYRLVQPSQSHSRNTAPDRRVFCYCFGLRPEDLLDTGSVNFSRLDNAYLQINYPTGATAWNGTTYIYARSKNVMKIMKGMAGRKFAA